jgi:hypothetical protein
MRSWMNGSLPQARLAVLLIAGMGGAACVQPAPPPNRGPLVKEGYYRGLFEAEREEAKDAVQSALEKQPSGQILQWQSDNELVSGSVRIKRTFKAVEGYYCREFEERIDPPRDQVRRRIRVACRVGKKWMMVQKAVRK